MVKFKNNQLKTKLFQECFENEYGFYTQPIITSDSSKILFANAYGKTKEECLSNAKLIAAAPEMLKMLQDILEQENLSQSATDCVIDLIKEATE